MSLRSLIACLSFAILASQGAESPVLSKTTLKIEKGNGPAVKLSFTGSAGQRYQTYLSRDLKDWEFLGDVLNGSDRTIEIDHNTTNSGNEFYRVEARPLSAPVTSRLDRGPSGEVRIEFPTAVARKYLVYSSADLNQWQVFSDLIDGTGSLFTAEIDLSDAPLNFFRVESADVLPLPTMVWIKPGTFTMGSPVDEKDRDLDEDPLTEVVLPLGFWMGKYEVTQREYQKVMGNNPSWFKGDSSWPVEQVSWNDASEFCAKLTQMEMAAGRLLPGYAYRLPTEAEFEYASRAGSTNRFSFGDDPSYQLLSDYAWYSSNSESTPHAVGQKKPNSFGLYDMNGNVWEWCQDWYGDRYPGGVVARPSGPDLGVSRVFRGGGWDYKASSCRSAYRNNVLPSRRANYLGFRIVLGPVLQ